MFRIITYSVIWKARHRKVTIILLSFDNNIIMLWNRLMGERAYAAHVRLRRSAINEHYTYYALRPRNFSQPFETGSRRGFWRRPYVIFIGKLYMLLHIVTLDKICFQMCGGYDDRDRLSSYYIGRYEWKSWRVCIRRAVQQRRLERRTILYSVVEKGQCCQSRSAWTRHGPRRTVGLEEWKCKTLWGRRRRGRSVAHE